MRECPEMEKAAGEVQWIELPFQPDRRAGSEHIESEGRSFLYRSNNLKNAWKRGNVDSVLRKRTVQFAWSVAEVLIP